MATFNSPSASTSVDPLEQPVELDQPQNPSYHARSLHPLRPRSGPGGESSGEIGNEDSGGAGNETDVEDADEEDSGNPSSRDQVHRLIKGERAMYPFQGGQRRKRRGSVAVQLSSSSGFSSSEEDDEEQGNPMEADEGDGASEMRRGRTRRTATPSAPFRLRPGPTPLPPPRLRRLGALGISVHSDEDMDDPVVSGLESADFRQAEGAESTDTRGTDLGIAASQLRRGTSSDEVLRSGRPRDNVGDEAIFRGVADDLVMQNNKLKSRLRRYEANNVPSQVKRDALFEIRFGSALPPDKRQELVEYLTYYAQGFGADAVQPSFGSSQAPQMPIIPPAPRPLGPTARTPDECRSACLAPPPGLAQEPLAGPSNSGLEPPSASGTGFNMAPPPRRTQPRRASDPNVVIASAADQATARDIVTALEQLFFHSLLRSSTSVPRAPSPLDGAQPSPPSNETYFSHLLTHDFLSQGFVYLNLACTMASIHRYSVTLSFVQQAIKQFSARLEVSQDGARIRWIGARSAVELKRDMGERSGDRGSTPPDFHLLPPPVRRSNLSGPSQVSEETVASTSTMSSKSSASRNLKSREGTRSGAAPSTAPTSQPSLGQIGSLAGDETGPRKLLRPPRPTAAVLQPMERLKERSELAAPTTESATTAKAMLGSTEGMSPRATNTAPSRSQTRRFPVRAHRSLSQRIRDSRPPETAFSESLAGTTHSRKRRREDQLSGSMVFYANGNFCTDLTKGTQAAFDGTSLPTMIVGASSAVALGANSRQSSKDGSKQTSSPPSSLETRLAELEGTLDVEMGEPPSFDSSEGQASAADTPFLRTSGMTTTSSFDLFTLLVKTHHPSKRPLYSSSSFLDDSAPYPPTKRARYLVRPQVLSTRTVYHSATTTTRDPFDITFFSSSGKSSPVELRYEEKQQLQKPTHPPALVRSSFAYLVLFLLLKIESLSSDLPGQLTASNLAKHANAAAAASSAPRFVPLSPNLFPPSPSPPHDDYLLSLSAPAHVWAPLSHAGSGRVPGKAVVGGRESLGLPSALGSGGDGSGTGTGLASTGDERPLSLDELVGLTRDQWAARQWMR
ncbi:hypothetical protein JCM11641_003187 [Rhodosporidiobolus odoratus]